MMEAQNRTPEIIEKAVKKYEWIKSIRLCSNKRDLGLHLANIMRKGFDFGIEYCMKNGIEYGYLGNVDKKFSKNISNKSW